MATYRQAVDQILGRFKTVWDASAAAAIGVGSPPTVLWPSDDPEKDPPSAPFARIFVAHDAGEQQTFGAPGGRTFLNSGIVVVQVFGQHRVGSGYDTARKLAEVAKAAFTGAATADVWFRNPRLAEIGPDGPFFQINVSADFEWSETV